MDGINDSMNMSLNKLQVIGKPGVLRFMGLQRGDSFEKILMWERLKVGGEGDARG